MFLFAGCDSSDSSGTTRSDQGTGGRTTDPSGMDGGMGGRDDGNETGDGDSGTGASASGIGGSDDGNQTDGLVPATCSDASATNTQFGCTFWPTITPNPVYTDFSFGVIIANPHETAVEVTIDGGVLIGQRVETVAPESSLPILLPWVAALKGPEFSRGNTSGGRLRDSVLEAGGAYRLVSSLPVSVQQANPMETVFDNIAECGTGHGTTNCYAASGDATVLPPQQSLTESYRMFTRADAGLGDRSGAPGGVSITATEDNTTVGVHFSPDCAANDWPEEGPCVAGGDGILSVDGNARQSWVLDRGDVLQLLAVRDAELSGSIVNASAPVQLIGFNPITLIPNPETGNGDHVESVVPPAESLGKRYVIAPPVDPDGKRGGTSGASHGKRGWNDAHLQQGRGRS